MPDTVALQSICAATLPALSSTFCIREIRAEFYPYIGLAHTLRRRGTSWIVRVSDHCRQAPPAVLEAIVTLLACKVMRRKPPAAALQLYEDYRRHPEVEQRIQTRRRTRGRKQIDSTPGQYHALAEIYGELNRIYFNGQVDVQRLGWGARQSWSRLGHYDPVHHTITISPVLDAPDVPKSVVAYLVYHEMLQHAVSRDRNRVAEPLSHAGI